jgi:hypothetical protein
MFFIQISKKFMKGKIGSNCFYWDNFGEPYRSQCDPCICVLKEIGYHWHEKRGLVWEKDW